MRHTFQCHRRASFRFTGQFFPTFFKNIFVNFDFHSVLIVHSYRKDVDLSRTVLIRKYFFKVKPRVEIVNKFNICFEMYQVPFKNYSVDLEI